MNLTESIKHLMSEGKLEWKTTDEVTGAEEATLPDGSKFAIHNITGTLSLMYVGKDGKGNVIYRTPAGVPMAFKKAKQEAEKFLGIKKDKDSKKDGENFIGAQGKNLNQSSANESESEVKEGAKTVLEWKPVDAIPGQEEASTDQGRYILFQHGLFWRVNFSPKGKERGVAKQIGKVNAQSSNAIAKAKQIAQSHANGENEELSHDRDWGTKMLTQQNKEVTPGQTNESQINEREHVLEIPQNGQMQIVIDVLRKDGYQIGKVKYAQDYGIKNPRVEVNGIMIRFEMVPYGYGKKFNVMGTLERGYGEDYEIKMNTSASDAIEAIKNFIQHSLNHSPIKKESLEKACWSGYKAIGTKEKDGKTVPNCVPEAIGQSGMDVASLATKMGFKKPSVRNVGGRKSYLFKNVMDVKLRASLENAGYPEVEAYTYGDGFVTDHKKGDVILRVGPAERGASSWLTIMSDYKTESMDEDLKSLQDLLNNPDEEFAVKNYGSVEHYKKMIQDKIDRLQKNEAISGAEQVTLKSTDKLEVKYGSVLVNGRPFDVTDPDESLDWPKSIDANGNLVTWFKGRASNANTWSPEEITGHYTDKQEDVGIEDKVEISERYVKTVQLITKETDRSLIEAFLTEHTIAGRESNLLAINTEFKRFKKFHQQ